MVIPTDVLNLAAVDLLAADTATLATAINGSKVSLVIAPFTPGPALDVADLTLATFTGSAAKVATPGTQTVAFNPITGKWFIALKEPVGGWLWVATVAPGTPQAVYGIVITDNAVAVTFGAELFDAPRVITNVGDSIAVGDIRMEFTFPIAG